MNDPRREVEILAKYVSEHPDFTEAEVLDALVRVGISASVVDSIYSFAQSAWGRALVANVGVNFSDEYVVANDAGNIVSRGNISCEPHFIEATEIFQRYRQEAGFIRFAAASSEYAAVAQMERTGKDPKKAKAQPQIRFTGEVTPEAVSKVLAQLNGLNAPAPKAVSAAFAEQGAPDAKAEKRPWWRWW